MTKRGDRKGLLRPANAGLAKTKKWNVIARSAAEGVTRRGNLRQLKKSALRGNAFKTAKDCHGTLVCASQRHIHYSVIANGDGRQAVVVRQSQAIQEVCLARHTFKTANDCHGLLTQASQRRKRE